jgi:hypothetical protein
MENQHRKISGYRELSQQEIDLMNQIKAKGSELLALHGHLVEMLQHCSDEKRHSVLKSAPGSKEELNRFIQAEPLRWAAIGKTDIQTGIMALVRAVAQPQHHEVSTQAPDSYGCPYDQAGLLPAAWLGCPVR